MAARSGTSVIALARILAQRAQYQYEIAILLTQLDEQLVGAHTLLVIQYLEQPIPDPDELR